MLSDVAENRIAGPGCDVLWQSKFRMQTRNVPAQEAAGSQVIQKIGEIFVKSVFESGFEVKAVRVNSIKSSEGLGFPFGAYLIDFNLVSQARDLSLEGISCFAGLPCDEKIRADFVDQAGKDRLAYVEFFTDSSRRSWSLQKKSSNRFHCFCLVDFYPSRHIDRIEFRIVKSK